MLIPLPKHLASKGFARLREAPPCGAETGHAGVGDELVIDLVLKKEI
jgi:hypothetical protein